MIDAHYTDPRLAALYDLDSGWSADRDFYLGIAGDRPKSVLDLGCGTGLLALALAAKGHEVTAVDPAEAMLAVARLKPGADKVRWVKAFAEEFRGGRQFDLVIMTGNALMALLTEDALAGVFATMRTHLAADGTCVFESRNPRLDWPARWNYEVSLETGSGTVTEHRRFLDMQGPLMRFAFDYGFPGETITTESRIRFWTREEIIDHLHDAGLNPQRVLGGWQAEPFDMTASDQMIFVAAQAPAQQA